MTIKACIIQHISVCECLVCLKKCRNGFSMKNRFHPPQSTKKISITTIRQKNNYWHQRWVGRNLFVSPFEWVKWKKWLPTLHQRIWRVLLLIILNKFYRYVNLQEWKIKIMEQAKENYKQAQLVKQKNNDLEILTMKVEDYKDKDLEILLWSKKA